MQQLNNIIENKIINQLTKSFSRSPNQLNKLHETDAEIIHLADSPFDLAITIDIISEEIKTGLYSDPYQIGWMSVMVNMSDLVAVGANPIGIVISQILPKQISDNFLKKLQKGINDACKKCGTYVLGGDTNFGDELIISGCAIGTIEKKKFLKRTKCKSGDKIYVSGKVGIGNAYAAQKLFKDIIETKLVSNPIDDIKYFPKVNYNWNALLKKYASCCIDTSDGTLSSIDQLMRLNNVGFKFRKDWIRALDKTSKELFEKLNLPLWLLLAGEHGEFRLLFSIPEQKESEFLKEAKLWKLNPVYLARVTTEIEVRLNLNGTEKILETEKIRNLSFDKNFEPSKYLQDLLEIDHYLKST